MRYYGRGVGITLGILLLLLLILPQQVAPPAQGVPGSMIQIAWPWMGAVNATQAVQFQAWVQYLLPGFAGLLAIIGACLPSPVRGLFIWLAGMVLLLAMELWGIFTVAGSAGGKTLLFWLLLAMTPSMFMIIGGHGAAMRRAGKIGLRLALGMPTLVVLAAIATALVIQLPKQQVMMSQFIPGGMMMPSFGATWLANLLAGLAWGFVGLVGVSVLLGVVNLFACNRGVGIGGYICGILGFFAFVAWLIVPIVVGIAQNAQMAVRPDLLCGGGVFAHMLAPSLFGLMLVLSGWGSMWKLDRPNVMQVNP